jgi:hypothetical protein
MTTDFDISHGCYVETILEIIRGGLVGHNGPRRAEAGSEQAFSASKTYASRPRRGETERTESQYQDLNLLTDRRMA